MPITSDTIPDRIAKDRYRHITPSPDREQTVGHLGVLTDIRAGAGVAIADLG